MLRKTFENLKQNKKNEHVTIKSDMGAHTTTMITMLMIMIFSIPVEWLIRSPSLYTSQISHQSYQDLGVGLVFRGPLQVKF